MESQLPSILCVDDDPDVLEVLKDHFSLQGFTVLTATNGVEACLSYKQWMPRAVVMDLFMPHLGGLGALGRMTGLHPGAAVILVSGQADALELVRKSGVAVAAVLPKPLDLRRLSATLERVGVVAPRRADVAADDRPPSPRARVLVVDDDLEVRRMLGEHLRQRRYEVAEAADGETALRRLEEFRPHIVLLDLMMAGLGGMETLRRVKAARPETCVIMVTVIEELESARMALGLGASDYVTKPFSLQYLDSVLESRVLMDRISPDPT